MEELLANQEIHGLAMAQTNLNQKDFLHHGAFSLNNVAALPVVSWFPIHWSKQFVVLYQSLKQYTEHKLHL